MDPEKYSISSLKNLVTCSYRQVLNQYVPKKNFLSKYSIIKKLLAYCWNEIRTVNQLKITDIGSLVRAQFQMHLRQKMNFDTPDARFNEMYIYSIVETWLGYERDGKILKNLPEDYLPKHHHLFIELTSDIRLKVDRINTYPNGKISYLFYGLYSGQLDFLRAIKEFNPYEIFLGYLSFTKPKLTKMKPYEVQKSISEFLPNKPNPSHENCSVCPLKELCEFKS